MPLFTIERIDGARYRWRFKRRGVNVANSLHQYSVRECKANLQHVVFWVTRKLVDVAPGERYILKARGEDRTSDLYIVPFLYGYNWRLRDARRIHFQPDLDQGLEDAFDAFTFFTDVRKAFRELPPKATRHAEVL